MISSTFHSAIKAVFQTRKGQSFEVFSLKSNHLQLASIQTSISVQGMMDETGVFITLAKKILYFSLDRVTELRELRIPLK